MSTILGTSDTKKFKSNEGGRPPLLIQTLSCVVELYFYYREDEDAAYNVLWFFFKILADLIIITLKNIFISSQTIISVSL